MELFSNNDGVVYCRPTLPTTTPREARKKKINVGIRESGWQPGLPRWDRTQNEGSASR